MWLNNYKMVKNYYEWIWISIVWYYWISMDDY